MSLKIYRVQDVSGRGPFKPGISSKWSDPDEFVELRRPFEFFDIMKTLKLKGIRDSYGFGFRTPFQLSCYFSQAEKFKLFDLGYFVAQMTVNKIIKESSRQILFWRNKPLYEDYIIYQDANMFYDQIKTTDGVGPSR